MNLVEAINFLIQEYGLLFPYALIAISVGLSSPHWGQLLAVLLALSAMYGIMRQTFETNFEYGLFDLALYWRIFGERGDMISGASTIFLIGLGAYLARGLTKRYHEE